MRVQVFGLQRSGTNYLHWILDHNFPVDVTKDGGWKHGFPWEKRVGLHGRNPLNVPIVDNLAALNIRPLVVAKDISHWLESIARAPKDYDRGASAVEQDRVKAWQRFYQEWAAYAPIIRYEAFIADFDSALRHLAGVLGVDPVAHQQPDKVPNSPNWRPKDRGRYV